jgi:hypothetical protein
MLKKPQTKKQQLTRLAVNLTTTPETNQNPKPSRTPNLAELNTRGMLHIIPLSSFYPSKIDMALKITIKFMIDHC